MLSKAEKMPVSWGLIDRRGKGCVSDLPSQPLAPDLNVKQLHSKHSCPWDVFGLLLMQFMGLLGYNLAVQVPTPKV